MRHTAIKGAVLLGVGAMLLAGCASGAGDTPADGESAAPADIVLSYSQPHTDPFQNAENVGSMEKFAELGYATIPATNADRDAAQQITDIQTLINKARRGS